MKNTMENDMFVYSSTKERILPEQNSKKSLSEYLSTNEKEVLRKHLVKSLLFMVK